MKVPKVVSGLTNFWCCPSCHGSLAVQSSALACEACDQLYRITGGVPDFRTAEAGGGRDQREADVAMSIVDGPAKGDAEGLVRAFFVAREGPGSGGRHATERRVRGTMAEIAKLRAETSGWLRPLHESKGPLLDVGCGLGALVAAFAGRGILCAGIDNRLDVLIVARAVVEALAGEAVDASLAAADATRLPVADRSVAGAIYYDVVEHLPLLDAAIGEAGRVTRAGGLLAVSTPNRYSLAAEPHLNVWGVGWMPRRWQASYAEFRSGINYSGTRLLSAREFERVVKRNTDFDVSFEVPFISGEDSRSFGKRRRVLARIYNGLAGASVARPALVRFGPFFRAVGRRAAR